MPPQLQNMPPSSESPSATYNQLQSQNTGTTSNSSHSANRSTTQGSQVPLLQRKWGQPRRKRTAPRGKFCCQHSSLRGCLKFSMNRDRKPRTALTLSSVALFAIFLSFLSVAARFAIKPLWIAVMMVGEVFHLALYWHVSLSVEEVSRC
jgi:hypothetical protein